MSKQAKIIPFPHMANDAYVKNIMSTADEIEVLRQQYDQNPLDDTFKQLICALQNNFQADDALALFHHYYPNIENEVNTTLDAVYIQLLLDCFEIKHAEAVLIDKYTLYQRERLDTFDLLQLFNVIEDIQQAIHEDTAAELTQIFHEIDTVNQLSFFQQRELLAKLNLITNPADYDKAVKQLLQSEQFHALLKAYLVEILLNKQLYHTMQMNWYGQFKMIDFDVLQPFEANETLAKLNNLIDDFLIDDFEKDLLKQNAFLYLTLVYPFIEEVVFDIEAFAQALLKRHQGKSYQNRWLNILEEEIQKMEIRA